MAHRRSALEYSRAVRRGPALLAAALVLALPASATAGGEPTMPLSQVHRGMVCTLRSVLQGTAISTFGATVLDIVDGQKAGEDTRILVRYSGDAITGTGVGEGFSGSPMSCPDARGVPRVVGALSEGIGEYGNDVGLVTPIGQMLGQRVRPPAGVHRRPALLARARPLEAMTFTGLAAPVRRALTDAAARAGRPVLAARGGPAAPRFAPQPLVPGAAVAVGYADGDFTAGAVGTVTYRNGRDLWAFGHPLDGAGRRALFLQDAYVYGIIGNPIGAPGLTTYKLAAPGHDLGILSADGPNAVAGTVGGTPAFTAFTVRVRDADTGRVLTAASRVADETDVGSPLGDSLLDLVAAGGTASLVDRAYRGEPASQTGRMCATITIRELSRPVGFCNRYVGTGGAASGGSPLVSGALSGDLTSVLSLVGGVDFAALHVTRVHVDVTIARGRHEAFIRSVRAPRVVRRGRRVRVTLHLQRYRGAAETRRVRVRIPRHAKPGRRRLVLAGPADDSGGDLGAIFQILLGGGAIPTGGGGPASKPKLVHAIRAVGRYDGVSALIGHSRTRQRVLRDPAERISGVASTIIRIR